MVPPSRGRRRCHRRCVPGAVPGQASAEAVTVVGRSSPAASSWLTSRSCTSRSRSRNTDVVMQRGRSPARCRGHRSVAARWCGPRPRTMPLLRPCAEPGCAQLVTGTRCDEHRKVEQNESRARNRRNVYGPEWPAIRLRKLRKNPTCERCGAQATVVDHKTPLRYFANRRAAHHLSNLASLCKPCHDRKTVTEDGGFGRSPHALRDHGPGD